MWHVTLNVNKEENCRIDFKFYKVPKTNIGWLCFEFWQEKNYFDTGGAPKTQERKSWIGQTKGRLQTWDKLKYFRGQIYGADISAYREFYFSYQRCSISAKFPQSVSACPRLFSCLLLNLNLTSRCTDIFV